MWSRLSRLVRSLAVVALAVIAASSVVLAGIFVAALTASSRTIDEATADVLTIAEMKVALADESRLVAVWVVAEAADGGQPPLVESAAGSIRRFTSAARSLGMGPPGPYRDRETAVVMAHRALVLSMANLDELAVRGGNVAVAYTTGHRQLEEAIASGIAALEAARTTDLELALLDSVSARDRLASLLPVMMLALVAALFSLWRLRLARRRADALQRLIVEKDVFIGTVSHELRTPLTGILGLTAELVENGEQLSAADRDQFQELVFTQALEMRDLIEDLLVAARSDIEDVGIRLTDLDLAEAVRRVLAESALMQSAEAPIVDLGEAALVVRADRMRFRQILRNLLTNAARYGGPHVSITFATRGSMGVVSVTDDGPGVPEGCTDLIFEPYRSAAGEERPTGSVGLGLAVSRTLARLMGGDLTHHRRHGTTIFELALPLADAAVPTAASPLAGLSTGT